MKTLIIVRHGKSSWEHDLEDIERPLKKRAFKDAEKVIAAFREKLQEPLVLWSSPAVRALETAKIIKETLDIPDECFFKGELYTFDDRSLLRTISTCDDSIDRLMIFGHNPAITEVVNSLGNEVFYNIPTTGLSQIEFESRSWKDLKNGNTLLTLFPKNL